MQFTKTMSLLTATTLVVGLGGGIGVGAALSGGSAVPAAAAGTTTGAARAGGDFPRGTGGYGGAGTSGKIASISGNTLEVQGTSGQTTITISSSTSISKTTTEKLTNSSLATGLCVRAVGTSSSNGTVTAKSLIITAPSSTGSCTTATGFPGAAGQPTAG